MFCKSSAISWAVSLITDKSFVEVEGTKICPFVVVQCPFDSFVKGLALEILRKIYSVLETKYYANAIRSHATTDVLIGIISQAALNHIGLLIIDEIQNVANSKNGKAFINALTQLINNSGISICMVGTPESTIFFKKELQLARRSVGLYYSPLQFDERLGHESVTITERYAHLYPSVQRQMAVSLDDAFRGKEENDDETGKSEKQDLQDSDGRAEAQKEEKREKP